MSTEMEASALPRCSVVVTIVVGQLFAFRPFPTALRYSDDKNKKKMTKYVCNVLVSI